MSTLLDLKTFMGGENRIITPFLLQPVLYAMPAIAMALLIAIPTTKIPGWAKQLLSIPLLIAEFMIPFATTNGNKIVELAGEVANFNITLRFLELYWVGPIVQKRPVYTTLESLFIDFWGCMRTFPKPAKQDGDGLKKGQVKEYPKDKKFYHIIFKLVGNIIITDIIGSWMTSFTIQEMCDMADNQPVMFFFFFFLVVMVLNSGFNVVGYSLQLTYCLLLEGGSYSSEQWRMFMVYPVLSNSLDDLWSHRWHQLLKSTWLAFPFRPVRILASRFFSKYMKNPSQIAFLCASLSVFVISGLMHEYIVAASIGWPVYSRYFMGEQQYFFTINGVGVLIEGLFKRFVAQKLPKQLKESIVGTLFGHLWVITFGYFNFYYIMHGFISWGFQYDNPFVFTKPFILNFVRETPAVQPFFGSLIH